MCARQIIVPCTARQGPCTARQGVLVVILAAVFVLTFIALQLRQLGEPTVPHTGAHTSVPASAALATVARAVVAPDVLAPVIVPAAVAHAGRRRPKVYVYEPVVDGVLLSIPPPPSVMSWDHLEPFLYHALLAYEGRVTDPEEADLFYIPHSTTLVYHAAFDKYSSSHHLLGVVRHVMRLPYFERTAGMDHFTSWSHGSFDNVLDAAALAELPGAFRQNCIFVVNQGDDGFRPHRDFNVRTAVVTLPPAMDATIEWHTKSRVRRPWAQRKYLAVFRGAIRPEHEFSDGVRQALAEMLETANDADIVFGHDSPDYAEEMREAKFCLFIKGWHVWSVRLGTIISAGCIPVIISDHYALPFFQNLDWTTLSLRVSEHAAIQRGYLRSFLLTVTEQAALQLEANIEAVRASLLYHLPPQPGDIFDRIMDELADRVPRVPFTSGINHWGAAGTRSRLRGGGEGAAPAGSAGSGWIPALPALESIPSVMSSVTVAVPVTAMLLHEQLMLKPWRTRHQSFLNVFMVWATHRDTWTAVQDRVVAGVLATIPSVRLRVLSNSLPRGLFAGLSSAGHDVSVMPFELNSLLQGLPGRQWIEEAMASRGAHSDTHVADFLRIVALYRYGGLYVDTDALWLRDPHDLPANFIGKIDFLKMEPTCSWCVDSRWYLANGVLSFAAEHPFLLAMLRVIDGMSYDPEIRTAIGPRFTTTMYLEAGARVQRDIVLLDEHVLYPIAGPDVPRYFVASDDSADVLATIAQHSYSAHVFYYTFSALVIKPDSVYGTLLRMSWPPAQGPMCDCTVATADGVPSALCLPLSSVIQHKVFPSPWYWPASRLCVKLVAARVVASFGESVIVTVAAERGVVRTWARSAARELTLPLAAPHFTSDDLASLEYRHVGGYCNDVVTVRVVAADGSGLTLAAGTIPVSAPCFDTAQLALPQHLRQPAATTAWGTQLGPVVPSVTTRDLVASPTLRANFTHCLRLGSREGLLGRHHYEPALSVGLIVTATGSYISWLDDLIASAEQHFLRGYEVHYFVVTDHAHLPLEPRGRIHVLLQAQLGWPYDSMFRHQLYLKHRALLRGMDFVMVLDADATFVAPVGAEVLGDTMGCQQSFFFGRTLEAPFESSDPSSSAHVPPGSGKCYYAGGLFGGSYAGFVRLLLRTTWLMEWDLAVLGRTALHDDESYLNKVFLLEPPAVSLGGNYIFPEPPADRAWGLSGVNWKAAFPPKILNLGARKWLGQSTGRERRYDVTIEPMALLTKGNWDGQSEAAKHSGYTGQSAARVAVGVCTSLVGSAKDRLAWMADLRASVRAWYADDALVFVMDTSTDALDAASQELVQPTVYLTAPLQPAAGTAIENTTCPPSALLALLSRVTSPYVLLLNRPAVLTWQSFIPFLERAVLGGSDHGTSLGGSGNDNKGANAADAISLVAVCPRHPSGAVVPAIGDCRPVSEALVPHPYPPASCALCDAASAGMLELQRSRFVSGAPAMRAEAAMLKPESSKPVLSAEAPMRSLACWPVDSLSVFEAVLVSTRAAVQLVQRVPDDDVALQPGCGVNCVLAQAVWLLRQRKPSATVRLLSCANDMQPLIRYDVSTADI